MSLSKKRSPVRERKARTKKSKTINRLPTEVSNMADLITFTGVFNISVLHCTH